MVDSQEGSLPVALKESNKYVKITVEEKARVVTALVALKTHEKLNPGIYAEPGYYVEVDFDGQVTENYILLKKRLPPTTAKGHGWVQIKKIHQ